ncbi:hypothetical protein J416_01174 [Gracilibacillus halophilus YIM-C55.5]|uniref:Pseudouridine synthase n=1 Tax=Gracilibacillus halophilus YIM-C55.5 TaxID=1308866 RepID=N4WDF0_9BACI|nr:RluA family pseudouridine synthase [Gracilibacillus halophilus]ENH98308.1 hypothetical protein J416_01174 [Gracilibacillus halophilus YIM-C55.5]
MEAQFYQVTDQDHNSRIDKLLVTITDGYSRTQIKTWFDEKRVKVNGTSVKQNYKCQSGDDIQWEVPEVEPMEIEPEPIPIDILYQDEDLLIVNKPSDMVVHPAPGHHHGTLVNALLYHCDDLSGINGVARPGIVHRIDKDTSGLLVVAKHDRAHERLSEQLKDKQIKRFYQAIVHGNITHEYGTIDAPIGRSKQNRQQMDVVENGKDAMTHFEVLERIHDQYTFIKCQLETGRTHQIRVHLKYIDHPIVGDPKYGQRKTIDVDGQALHAYYLGLYHPMKQQWMEWEVAPPEKFKQVLHKLRQND